MKQSHPNFMKRYHILFVLILLFLSILFTVNQLCYKSIIKIDDQILNYAKQIDYQIHDKNLFTQFQLPTQHISILYHPMYLILGSLILLYLIMSIRFSIKFIHQEQSLTNCFIKNIILPIIIVFSIMLLFFLLFQTQIESMINQMQIYLVNTIVNDHTHLPTQFTNATTNNHFTVKLPTTYTGLIQINQLTSHQWSLLIVSTILKNMVILVIVSITIYYVMWFIRFHKTPGFSSLIK